MLQNIVTCLRPLNVPTLTESLNKPYLKIQYLRTAYFIPESFKNRLADSLVLMLSLYSRQNALQLHFNVSFHQLMLSKVQLW